MAFRRGTMVDVAHGSMSPSPEVPRSMFDVRHFHKTTFGAGDLFPVYVDEVLPGDSHRVKMSAMVRAAPLLVPPLDNLYLETFWFFVPNRLLWSHWENFMGSTNVGESTSYLTPYLLVAAASATPGSIYDYMGIPAPAGVNTIQVSAFPFRAYNLIYNEWFRDEKLQAKVAQNTGDGPDALADYALKPINKKHDYFTSCRPWPQAATNMGDTGTTTFSGPLDPSQSNRFLWPTYNTYYGAGAPVSGLGVAAGAAPGGAQAVKEPGARAETFANAWKSSVAGQELYAQATTAAGVEGPYIRVLVNDMRMAATLQHMLEIDARGGTRYSESIFAHFRVRSPDARLQRPEFLGSGKTVIVASPVAQTSASGAGTKLGQLAAHGYAAAHHSDHGFGPHSFTEHGWILGLAAVRGELTYQQGVNRMWRRRTRVEFYIPALAHLGEQPVMSSEIYADGSANDQTVFGYQMRWDEYRWKESRISGYMRSNSGAPLDMWHYAENFGARPTLDGFFVEDLRAIPIARNFQATAPYSAQFVGDFMFDCRYVRPMPMFSVPGVGSRL